MGLLQPNLSAEISLEYSPASFGPVVFNPAEWYPEECDETDVQQPWPEHPVSWLDIHEHPARIKVVVAGRQSGKTFGARMHFIVFEALRCTPAIMRQFHNALECWYVAPTQAQGISISWAALKYITKDLTAGRNAINENEHRITLRNGMPVVIKGSEQGKDRLEGVPQWTVLFDEAAEHNAAAWREHIEPSCGSAPLIAAGGGRVIFIGTPKGYNHFRDKFILGLNDPTGRYKSWRWASWQSQYANIPDLSARYKEHKAKGALGMWRQEYGADFTSAAGRIYPKFDREQGGIHVKAFEIDPMWDTFIAVDNGADDPTAALFGGIDYYGRLWIRREHVRRGLAISQHVAGFKRIQAETKGLGGRRFTIMVMDGTNKQLFFEYGQHGMYFSSAGNTKNTLIPGIRRVEEMLLPRADGLPMIIIHPDCPITIDQMSMYQWKPTQPGKNSYEVPLKFNDHTCDALRYIAMQRPEPALLPIIETRSNIEIIRDQYFERLRRGSTPRENEMCDILGGS